MYGKFMRLATHSSFVELGVNLGVAARIAKQGFLRPTEFQRSAIPVVLQKTSALFIAQTGIGKTLGYAAPVASMMLRDQSSSSIATVLVPTRELREQVENVFKGLGVYVFSDVRMRSNSGFTEQPGVLVVTPGKLLQGLQTYRKHASRVSWTIFDEVDSLFDGKYKDESNEVVRRLRLRQIRDNMQLILVGATRTAAVDEFVTSNFPGIKCLVSSDAHCAPKGLEQRFLPIGARPKLIRLLDAIRTHQSSGDGGKTLIFCNTLLSCEYVSNFLNSSGVPCMSLRSSVPSELRKKCFERFKSATGSGPSVLVSTSILSRGIDMPGVSHVINFDFPQTLAEYLNRVGRTARAGRSGAVSTLCSRKHSPLMRRILSSSKASKPIDFSGHSKTSQRILKVKPSVSSGRSGNKSTRSHEKRETRSPRRSLTRPNRSSDSPKTMERGRPRSAAGSKSKHGGFGSTRKQQGTSREYQAKGTNISPVAPRVRSNVANDRVALKVKPVVRIRL